LVGDWLFLGRLDAGRLLLDHGGLWLLNWSEELLTLIKLEGLDWLLL